MRRGALIGIAAVGVLALGATVGVVAISSQTPVDESATPAASPTTSPSSDAAPGGLDAVSSAEAFLDEWVDDGRVVRRDEGGDTVSEGQAYGLLAAVVADDEQSFDEIWEWTTDELERPDGLLAWQWDDGAVVDDEPASDADLDAARALVLAGDRFGRDDLTAAGSELGAVILDRLTVETAYGRIMLPGLWAAERTPLPYNPSYASPAAFDILSAATGDPRWGELSTGSRAVTTAILDATDLPPDWAQIQSDGRIEPMPGPFGEGDPVQYGFDAPRLLIRYAESCDPADVALAASALPALSYQDEPAARLDLGGGAISEERSALAFAARGAAEIAAGDADRARDDLGSASALGSDYPTYYGHAWITLSSAMLTDDALGGCPPLES
ncbi:glycosyl hydrolase family 8 [Planococcus sp. APC 4015]|nr:glycosyl hydrolase family 8 [Planococcus sp. APC 4015]